MATVAPPLVPDQFTTFFKAAYLNPCVIQTTTSEKGTLYLPNGDERNISLLVTPDRQLQVNFPIHKDGLSQNAEAVQTLFDFYLKNRWQIDAIRIAVPKQLTMYAFMSMTKGSFTIGNVVDFDTFTKGVCYWISPDKKRAPNTAYIVE